MDRRDAVDLHRKALVAEPGRIPVLRTPYPDTGEIIEIPQGGTVFDHKRGRWGVLGHFREGEVEHHLDDQTVAVVGVDDLTRSSNDIPPGHPHEAAFDTFYEGGDSFKTYKAHPESLEWQRRLFDNNEWDSLSAQDVPEKYRTMHVRPPRPDEFRRGTDY